MARYLLELSLLESQCVVFLPVQLAGAALCLSRQVLQEPPTPEGEAAWCLASSIHVGRCVLTHNKYSPHPEDPCIASTLASLVHTELWIFWGLTSQMRNFVFCPSPSYLLIWFYMLLIFQWDRPAEDHAHSGQRCSQGPHPRDLCYFY